MLSATSLRTFGQSTLRTTVYLERRFGDAYVDYKRRVRRWL